MAEYLQVNIRVDDELMKRIDKLLFAYHKKGEVKRMSRAEVVKKIINERFEQYEEDGVISVNKELKEKNSWLRFLSRFC